MPPGMPIPSAFSRAAGARVTVLEIQRLILSRAARCNEVSDRRPRVDRNEASRRSCPALADLLAFFLAMVRIEKLKSWGEISRRY